MGTPKMRKQHLGQESAVYITYWEKNDSFGCMTPDLGSHDTCVLEDKK